MPPPIPARSSAAKAKPAPLPHLLGEAAAAAAIPTALSSSPEERLKIYLRIRPFPKAKEEEEEEQQQQPRRAAKQARAGDGVCLVAMGPTSVALTVPLVDHKRRRVATEIFDGFSAVLPPEASQHDIFTRVMNPLVDEFLGGKSGLLVAMGPTVSGKTHTVFGTAGILPLTLHKIFNVTDESTQLTRSFCLSMFEIICEGKSERIVDLLSDATNLVLQQSTIIKGLNEVSISNVMDAECLVSHGMLKRSTAATNANSDSSQSHCVITIRAIHKNNYVQSEHLVGGSVLTIAHLASVEQEKSTGYMRSRLLESNFINNKSMVFGNCLRALLDHQKNPKKTLENHFKNSRLTRYLRDYLEGRKKMTLILDVEPGDDDYSDTSYLLRQASPCMKIRYTSVDDSSDLASQKRSSASLICQENRKVRKANATTKDRRQPQGTTYEKENCPAQRVTIDKKEGRQAVGGVTADDKQEDPGALKPSQKTNKTTRCSSPPHDGGTTVASPLDLDDLLLEIISRVPARERWRCKKVCKRWLCLTRKLPQSLAGFFYTSYSMERFPAYALHFFNISASGPERPLIYPSFDFLPDHRKIDLLDCCNGLLLCRLWSASVEGCQYIVCNPATKEWVLLPYTGHADIQVLAPCLGFDPVVSSHFHVFFLLGNVLDITGVLLYSSETRSWVRKEKGWDQELQFQGRGGREKAVFLNGYMHFHVDVIVEDSGERLLLPCLAAVDTNGETWTIVSLPTPDGDDEGFIQLSQGSLHYARLEWDTDVDDCRHLAVYVLEDYDSKQFKLKHRVSTIDMFSVEGEEDYEDVQENLMDHFEWVAIHPECNVIFFTMGFFIMGQYTWFKSYNMDLQKVKEIRGLRDGEPPYLPYVPLYAELQSLRM